MSQCPALATLASTLLSGKILQVLPEPLGTLPASCVKIVVSELLGYGIVAGSALVKLPQLIKIVRAESAEGISLSSMFMEMCASISSFCYYISLGFPFSTWGEHFFLFFQNIALTILVFHYAVGLASSKALTGLAFCIVLAVVLYAQLLPSVTLPSSVCSSFGLSRCTISCSDVAGTLPSLLMLFGRLPQIAQNFNQGHTGQLALITYLLNAVGSLARIFTTIQQLNDPITLFTVTSATIQNTVLTLQIIFLGPAPSATPARKDE